MESGCFFFGKVVLAAAEPHVKAAIFTTWPVMFKISIAFLRLYQLN